MIFFFDEESEEKKKLNLIIITSRDLLDLLCESKSINQKVAINIINVAFSLMIMVINLLSYSPDQKICE
ncbi:hypothetical protein FQA39_LY07318 [Lamprigera yunnana]|nr:hypothetical protein FQA39_LY07318 [Lamprigera yunnana]